MPAFLKSVPKLGVAFLVVVFTSCNVVSYEERVNYLNTIRNTATQAHQLHTQLADSLDDGNDAWRQRAINQMLDSLPVFEARLQSMSLDVPAADTLRDAALVYVHTFSVGWLKEFDQVAKLYNEDIHNPVRLAEMNTTIEKLYNDFEVRRNSAKQSLDGAALAFSVANRIE
jgi:hypothetical protein